MAPWSLGWITKSIDSRSRGITIPIYLSGVRPHLEDYTQDWLLSTRGVLTNCSLASKGPHGGGLEHTVHKEKAGGAGLVRQRRPRGCLVAVCSYLKEEGRRRERGGSQTLRRGQTRVKKQGTNVETKKCVTCKKKFLPLESSSGGEEVPKKTGISPSLEVFRSCVSKALSKLVYLWNYPAVSRELD